MPATISYEDYFEHPITAEQVQGLEQYIKVTNVDGLAKIKEEFDKGKLTCLMYYKDPGEVTNTILETYRSIRDIEIRERQTVGNYTLVNDECYREGVLTFKGRAVFDRAGRKIYSCPIDAVTNVQDFDETTKTFYDPVTGDKMYVFWYGRNGVLSAMDSHNPIHASYINEFKDFFNPDELATLEGLDWPNMTYFHAAEPVIPAEEPLQPLPAGQTPWFQTIKRLIFGK